MCVARSSLLVSLVVMALVVIGCIAVTRMGEWRLALRARREAPLRRRERLARELHDTLLQETQGLLLSLRAAAAHLPQADATRILIESTLQQGDRLVKVGRIRSEALGLPPDEQASLDESLAAIAIVLVRAQPGARIAADVEVLGTTRPCHADTHDQACFMAREALLDPACRAGAKAIEIQVIYGDDALRVRIRNDGIGLAGQAACTVPSGLRRVGERARALGAAFEVWSAPGAGTELELVVPAGIAYQAA